jgi:hypothetical protein
MFRLFVLTASLLLPLFANGEVSCVKSTCFDPRDAEATSESLTEELRVVSDEYIAILLSDSFQSAAKYWNTNARGEAKTTSSLLRIRETVGFADGHQLTEFRQTFSVPEANGRTGYFIVVEYGTQTEAFDVIQHVLWEADGKQWRVVCHGYVFRCPPDSTPVDLSSRGP